MRFAIGELSYAEQFQAAFVPVRIVNEDSRAVTIERACVIVGGVQYEASEPICSVGFGDRELLQRPPIRLSARDAVQGAWVFRGIAGCPFQEKILPAIELVTKVVGRRAKRHVLVRGGDAGKSGTPSAYIPDDGSIR